MNSSWRLCGRLPRRVAHGSAKPGTGNPVSGPAAFGIGRRNATPSRHDADQTDFSRARPRSRPLHRGRDACMPSGSARRGRRNSRRSGARCCRRLLSSHRPLGAYEVIDELAKSMPRPAPITVYRALDFLMENGLVHRIESRNAFLACAHDHDATAMVAFLICEHCGSVGEIPAAPGGAKPQRRGARQWLCAKTVGGRNHRHLRALPAGRITTRRQAGHEDRCRQTR